MGIKFYNPYTPSRRYMSCLDFLEITKKKPFKILTKPLKKKSGRNNYGKITIRHHGGRNKRKYRIIDFKRDKNNIYGKVKSIEYDPNRTVNIALISYKDGEKRYILAPKGLKIGMNIKNGINASINIGNCLPLFKIPIGTMIHNIELLPKKGGQLVRSAGNAAQLIAKKGNFATIRLPSNEMRMILINCSASIGILGNEKHNLINIGKAGRNRNIGIRPTVRGSAMNPNDHPHGGGEGKVGIGRKNPCTPWGKPAIGLRTRKKNKKSDKYIIKRKNGKNLIK